MQTEGKGFVNMSTLCIYNDHHAYSRINVDIILEREFKTVLSVRKDCRLG